MQRPGMIHAGSIDDFNHTIDHWITALHRYDFTQLCTKPSPTNWSLGQVYMHLIENTDYFIEQTRICLTTNDHALEEASPEGKAMLLKNDFPDEALEGPPENLRTPQPASKEQLTHDMVNLKNKINNVAALIHTSPFKGKTKHPGLNYFSANEWLQFAEMHLRHHLRQKKRIDAFLEAGK